MLNFSIYLLTAILFIDCLFLVLLVLVQLPKKEAGMGQAFGGGATDALFGAGSGNVLTKVTKWAAGIFFALAITLTMLGTYKTTSGGGGKLQRMLSEPTRTPAGIPVPPGPNAAAPNTAAPANDAPAGTPTELNLNLPKETPAPPADK